MKRIFLSLVVVVYLVAGVSAQEYGFDVWTTENGLPQNTVTGIAQTPDGYLWLATFDGLARFDGVRFVIFDKGNSKGIVNNRFIGIYADRDGAVWAWTENGVLTVYRGGVFTSYSTPEGLREIIVDVWAGADGRAIIETKNRYYYLQDVAFVPVAEENKRLGQMVYFGRSGAKWIFETHGITRRGADGLDSFYPLEIKPEWLFYTRNYAPFEDSRGALWGRSGKDIFRLQNGVMTLFAEKDILGLKDLSPYLFLEAADGAIWFVLATSLKKPIKIGRFKDERWQIFDVGEALTIRGALIDREGNFWLATETGLRRWRRQIITTLSEKDGLNSNEVYPLLEAVGGEIYIGTIKGVNRWADGKITSLGLLQSDGYPIYTRGLWEDEQARIWVGGFGDFGRLENGSLRRINTKNITNGVTAFASDRAGGVWLATSEGLLKYQDDVEIARYTTADGLPHNEVITIHFDRNGNLWAGTFDGLAMISGRGDAETRGHGDETPEISASPRLRVSASQIQSFNDVENSPQGFVRAIYEDVDGVLWFGTYGDGLARYKDGKFFNYRVEHGLFNNGVFAILEDNRGNFWMSSNRGIHRVNKQELNDFADGKIPKLTSVSYDEKDGMLNAECNGGRIPAAIKTKDGKFWFPTMGGVAIVDPEAEETNPNPPPVLIENVSIDRKSVDVEKIQSAIRNPNSAIELNPGQSNVELNYTGLSLIKSGQIKFRYRLEGLEENWVEAGTVRTVNYSYLPAGNYTFRVIAANANGVWNTEGAAMKIIVHPYFYQTWWFLVLAAVAVALVIRLIYHNRISHLREIADAKTKFSRQLIESQEAERKRIASELHDGLGQSLAIISNRAAMGKNKIGEPEIAAREFDEISQNALSALDEVQAITANLHPHYLERLGLTKALRAMFLKVSDVVELNCEMDSIDDTFPKDAEINVYRIVQESLNNVIKHSEASEVEITIKKSAAEVVISIKDDGRGFDTDNVKSNGGGLGLIGLKERTNMLGGAISINSSVGSGAEIKVILPIKNSTGLS